MSSAESLFEYTDAFPLEEQRKNAEPSIKETPGLIKLENVSMKYRPDLRLGCLQFEVQISSWEERNFAF